MTAIKKAGYWEELAIKIYDKITTVYAYQQDQ